MYCIVFVTLYGDKHPYPEIPFLLDGSHAPCHSHTKYKWLGEHPVNTDLSWLPMPIEQPCFKWTWSDQVQCNIFL